MGYRAGENSQLLALAEALGWPFEIKRLAYRCYDFLPGLLRQASLLGVRRQASSPLRAPWPDLVISAGMRNEPVCRWIKQQSGDISKLVHIGRTWADTAQFDLIITTPQYRLPQRDNILHNATTLHRVKPQRLQAAVAEWTARLAQLPRPYITVIIGGNSGPCTIGRRAAVQLARQASAMARACGGSLLVTSSARTPDTAIDCFEATVDCPMHLYRWQADDADNPYYAYLALAEKIIVSGDSIAMLSEACATGKPVSIFDLDPETTTTNGRDFRLGASLYRLLMRFGPQRLSRDIRLVHHQLITSGHAAYLGQALPDKPPPPLEDVQQAVSRDRHLLKSES